MYNVNDKDSVIPGQILGSTTEHDLTCFRENDTVISSVVGVARLGNDAVRIVPSSGVYVPKTEDVILAVVIREHSSCWDLDINSPYGCILIKEKSFDDRRFRGPRTENNFLLGDLLSVKISNVNEINFSQAMKPWKLDTGRILEVDPKRVPRVIGKQRSMLNLLKEKTQCSVIVGQNGRIWIKGPKEDFVVKVIEKIVKEAQTQGLTDRIENLLNEEAKNEE